MSDSERVLAFHVHTSYSADCSMSPKRLIQRCVDIGIDILAITDHNTIDGALKVRDMAPFEVIIGEEIFSDGGEIIGLFLDETIPRGLSPQETIERIREQDGLVVIPHPFDSIRKGSLERKHWADILPGSDLIEVYNSRTLRTRDRANCVQTASSYPHLVPIVGSDAHFRAEIGNALIQIKNWTGARDDFARAVSAGETSAKPSGFAVHVGTRMVKSGFLKRIDH